MSDELARDIVDAFVDWGLGEEFDLERMKSLSMRLYKSALYLEIPRNYKVKFIDSVNSILDGSLGVALTDTTGVELVPYPPGDEEQNETKKKENANARRKDRNERATSTPGKAADVS